MWMVDPKILCTNHLLGEHNEYHKFKHIFEKHYSIHRYILNNCIEPLSMKKRHDDLVSEMINRGFKHKSDYTQPDVSYLPDNIRNYKIDINKSLNLLLNRCTKCTERYYKIKKGEVL